MSLEFGRLGKQSDSELDEFLRLVQPRPQVRSVEFLVDSPEIPQWVAACIRRVADLSVEVRVRALGGARPDGLAWSRWSGARIPWTTVADALLGELPGAELRVNFSSREVDGTAAFAIDGRMLCADLREFFLHAVSGAPPFTLSLQRGQEELGAIRTGGWNGMDWQRHARTVEALPALLVLALCGKTHSRQRQALEAAASAPGAVTIASFVLGKMARSALVRVTGEDIAGNWEIAVQRATPNPVEGVPNGGWQWTRGFAGHQAADPFLAEEGGKLWLFFEDLMPPNGFGRLAVMAALGEPEPPKVILEKPYHLSYPHVFRHGGEWWMIPESGNNRSVDLYRAAEFPYRWEHERTLFEGYRLTDTTPLFHEGRWYFFTCGWLPGRAQFTLLFTAEDLTAPWMLHPASPLTLDAGEARGAGAVFEQDGRLFRPVQDCATKYGYAIRFREILELSPTVCREQTVRTLGPDWHAGLEATHTFHRTATACTLDGQAKTSRTRTQTPARQPRIWADGPGQL